MSATGNEPSTNEPSGSVEVTTSSNTATTTKTFDETYVQGLRAESADWRTKLRAKEQEAEELRTKVTEFERSQMAEADRIKAELEEARNLVKNLSSQNKATQLEAAVAKNVVKFELVDADAALRLLDKSLVEYGSDNRPTNIEDVLSKTLERYPFLKSQAPAPQTPAAPPIPDPGATNAGKSRGGSLTMDKIRNMTSEERMANLKEIQEFAANGYK